MCVVRACVFVCVCVCVWERERDHFQKYLSLLWPFLLRESFHFAPLISTFCLNLIFLNLLKILFSQILSLMWYSEYALWDAVENFIYRMCHGFRLTKQNDYFWVFMTTFEVNIIFWGSWGSIKNWQSQKPNHHIKV